MGHLIANSHCKTVSLDNRKPPRVVGKCLDCFVNGSNQFETFALDVQKLLELAGDIDLVDVVRCRKRLRILDDHQVFARVQILQAGVREVERDAVDEPHAGQIDRHCSDVL